jgi:hypothetical protein
MAMWVAYCSGGDWAVYLAPSGMVQARPCNKAGELKLPTCQPSPPDPTRSSLAEPKWPEPPPPPRATASF